MYVGRTENRYIGQSVCLKFGISAVTSEIRCVGRLVCRIPYVGPSKCRKILLSVRGGVGKLIRPSVDMSEIRDDFRSVYRNSDVGRWVCRKFGVTVGQKIGMSFSPLCREYGMSVSRYVVYSVRWKNGIVGRSVCRKFGMPFGQDVIHALCLSVGMSEDRYVKSVRLAYRKYGTLDNRYVRHKFGIWVSWIVGSEIR